jgi:hypothetical protein
MNGFPHPSFAGMTGFGGHGIVQPLAAGFIRIAA